MPKKLDGLRIAREIAASRGGRCSSGEYIDIFTNMDWECKERHQWRATLNNIKNHNRWCPKCAIKIISEKNTLQDGLAIARKIAIERGGRCLSNEYISIETKMEWECSKQHRWFAILNSIKNANSWCPICSKIANGDKIKTKDGLKIAQQMAQSCGGKCLSLEYIGARYKMLWECAVKHQWYALFYNIQSGHWCPECGNINKSRSQTNSTILKHWKTDKDLVCQASWEKAVVNYLNNNKINFRWQSKTFKTPFLKLNGENRTYRPDLYLFSTKQWIEIKGYFRGDAQEKWDWFRKEHPNSELWNKEKLKEMKIL